MCLGAEGTGEMDQTIPVCSPAVQHHVRRLPETCTCSIYEQKTKGESNQIMTISLELCICANHHLDL